MRDAAPACFEGEERTYPKCRYKPVSVRALMRLKRQAASDYRPVPLEAAV
jgi:hypothetical protein